jgi:hypothetical protein
MGIVVTILFWQARYTWSVGNPMYGWPMPFDNLWYLGQRAWSPLVLAVDIVFWGALAASTAFTIERWLRKPQKTKLTLRGLLAIQCAVAVVLAAGVAENYLRNHPNNDSLFPRYGKVTLAHTDIWFDIGLFSAPVSHWPLMRLPIVFAIGCAAYAGICVLGECAGGRRSNADTRHPTISEPAIARIAERLLSAIIILLALLWVL